MRNTPIMETLTGIMIAVLLIYSGTLINNDELEINNFFSFLAAMMLAYQPVRALAGLNISINQGLTAAKRVLPIVDIENEIKDNKDYPNLIFKNGEINFSGQKIQSHKAIKKSNFSKTQIGIRPEFINFSKDGIPVKIKRVSNTGRHKIVDTECNGGNIKILSNASTEIPSESAHITFNQKYTYVYGDNWIIE